MSMTMSIARDYLIDRYPAVTIGSKFDPALFVRVAYDGLRDGASQLTDELYVVSGSALAERRESLDDCMLERCVVVVSPGDAASYDCALSVSTLESIEDVVESLEDALLKHKRVMDEAAAIALSGGDISQLVNCAHKLLRNPILVHDAAARVKARTEVDIMYDDLWMFLDSTLPAHEERAIPEGLANFIAEVSVSNEVRRYDVSNGGVVYSLRTKEIGGAFLIISLLQKNKEITEGDCVVLRMLCRFIELGMKTNVRFVKEEIGYNGLLLDVLEGRIKSPVEFSNRMSALGYEVKAKANVIVVEPLRGEFSDRQAQRLIDDIYNTFPFGMGVRFSGRLVFYGTYDEAGTITSGDFARFEAFLRKFKMAAALGSTRPIDRPVVHLYRNALANLSVGRKVHPDKHLLTSEDCQPYWMYEACVSHGNPELYIHPAIGILRRHDMNTRDALFEVLSKLALNRGNRSVTAQKLFVQRNTLQSRIREIEMICRIDLSDPLTIDHIRRSIILEGYRDSVDIDAEYGGAL